MIGCALTGEGGGAADDQHGIIGIVIEYKVNKI